jgi:hypothetical protein
VPLIGELEDEILGRLLTVSGKDRGAFQFFDDVEPGDERREEIEAALVRMKETGNLDYDEPITGVSFADANLRITQAGRLQCLLNEGPILRTVMAGTSESIFDVAAAFQRLREETEIVDSALWTGLTERIGNERITQIRENVVALILTIEQAEMTDRARHNALRRARAVEYLLQAPDPPWRTILDLLTSTPLTAFLNAAAILTIIQSVF